jgi:hypothetical protein
LSLALSAGGTTKLYNAYKENGISVRKKPRGWIYFGAAMAFNTITWAGVIKYDQPYFVLALSGSELFNILTLVNSNRFILYNPYGSSEHHSPTVSFSPIFSYRGDAGLKAVINF